MACDVIRIADSTVHGRIRDVMRSAYKKMLESVARAAVEGYGTKERSEKPAPFQGYYFKFLRSQGSHATGGAYDYVVKGKMILGFAILAYPANYRTSGIMTFVVNQEGWSIKRTWGRIPPKWQRP